MMKMTTFDKEMAAVTFAEAGEHESAKSFSNNTGATRQAKSPASPPEKKRPYAKVLIFGSISVMAYVLLFTNEKLITTTFTMGGWHTILPVGTAFFFSFTHGAFASNLLTTLGIEAKK